MTIVHKISAYLPLMVVTTVLAAAENTSFEQVAPERIGEFVKVSGTIREFHNPPEPRAPFAFTLADKSDRQMRVVVWPDIFDRIDHRNYLKQPGTSVTLTGEVADYKDKLELHLQDWEEITVTPPDAVTTSALDNNAASTGSLRWKGGDMTTSIVEMKSLQADRKITTGTVEP